jgi:hypothetical protein
MNMPKRRRKKTIRPQPPINRRFGTDAHRYRGERTTAESQPEILRGDNRDYKRLAANDPLRAEASERRFGKQWQAELR